MPKTLSKKEEGEEGSSPAVLPDWAIFCNLETINLPKSLTLLGIFVKVLKSIIFLVSSISGNFYIQFAIFFWSHWLQVEAVEYLLVTRGKKVL